MNKKNMTIEEAKQKIAEKNGCKDWQSLILEISKTSNNGIDVYSERILDAIRLRDNWLIYRISQLEDALKELIYLCDTLGECETIDTEDFKEVLG